MTVDVNWLNMNSGDESSFDINSLWTLDCYRKFFDVSTEQVLRRLLWSMVPNPRLNFFDLIKPNPDLYGPLWISITLILTVAMSGNVGNYLRYASSNQPINWKYEFHLISLASTCVLSYVWLLPLILWSFIKWNSGNSINLTYIEITCIYGYIISIFVPICVLWTVQIFWIQCVLAVLATILSGTILLKSILPLMTSDKLSYGAIMILCHFLLAISLLFNCFIESNMNDTINNNNVTDTFTVSLK